jgi:hypothetical protein
MPHFPMSAPLYVSTFHKPIPYDLFILLIIVIEVTSTYRINDYDHKYD